ncbi:hypothetical protein HYV64_05215 [Candidatus Shapirobacteria bacterium]|nr:hypothetical protein [Candidatus Shapirobacteria bacterium]
MSEKMSAPQLIEETGIGHRISYDYKKYLQEIAPGLNTNQLDSSLQKYLNEASSALNKNRINFIPGSFFIAMNLIIALGVNGEKQALTDVGWIWGILNGINAFGSINDENVVANKATTSLSTDINSALKSEGILK